MTHLAANALNELFSHKAPNQDFSKFVRTQGKRNKTIANSLELELALKPNPT